MARTLVLVAVVLCATACGGGEESAGLPTGAEQVSLDPATFTITIDNPWWPMRPGSTWVYRSTDQDGTEQRIVVTVTPLTRTVDGVEARVVHDVASEDGAVVEDTYDWYAQDGDGNVWYLGEDTKELDHGVVTSTEGSWEAGVDGAQPGVVLPAAPTPGLAYRQEHLPGEAEDRAAVLSVDERVDVPAGAFTGVLMTKEWSPLEPSVLEHKLYARGVGQVLSLMLAGGTEREELVRYTPGG